MAGSSPSLAHEAELSEESYLARLDARLTAAANAGRTTFDEFVEQAKGAFPALVFERIRELEIPIAIGRDQPLSTQPSPELHPLDFEWYFTARCAGHLAKTVARQHGPVVCLGAPTVAKAIAEDGLPVTLVDQSPYIEARLGAQPRLSLYRHDLRSPLADDHGFGCVFFDAPWYCSEMLTWLWQAARIVRTGGSIVFPLLPSCVRPAAPAERAALLRAAEALGPTRVIEGAARYDTPLFEAEALRAAGIPIPPAWRVADLVIVSDVMIDSPEPPMTAPSTSGAWDSWVIGSQVIRLRRDVTTPPAEPIAKVPGAAGWIYTSVSRRDPSRELVDLWTSRNRVARVRDTEAVAQALDSLERSQLATVRDAHTGDPELVGSLREILAGLTVQVCL